MGIKTRDERIVSRSYPAKSRSSWLTSTALSSASNASGGGNSKKTKLFTKRNKKKVKSMQNTLF